MASMKISGLGRLVGAMAMLLMAAPSAWADKHVVKISSDPWEPWVMGTEGEAATGGLGVEVAREVFKRIDVPIDIRIYPYERCLRQMQAGERDVLLMAKKTPEREQYMAYSDVAATDPQLIYYWSETMPDFQWNDWDDLKPHTIGGVRGFNYGELSEKAESHGLKTEFVDNDGQNLRKLMSGRIDLVILNRATANHFIKQNPELRGKLKAASKPMSVAEFHFALSRKGGAIRYLDAINAALNDMKADGSLERLLNATE